MRKSSIKESLLTILIVLVGLSALPTAVHAEQLVSTNQSNLIIVGEEEFMAGYFLIPGLPIFWESDEPWRLTVSSVDPDLGISDDARYIKPLDDLRWKLSEEQVWLPVSRDLEEIDWSTETESGVIYIDVMVLLDWLTDAPGEYHADIVFTIESI